MVEKSCYYIGLDLGQAQDYTALSVIEKITVQGTSPNGFTTMGYHIRHLQRFELGTTYPIIVDMVKSIMSRISVEKHLILDYTGVGRPVYDLFKQARFSPIGVNITGGNAVTVEKWVYSVPKRDLVSVLAVAFQTGNLKIAGSLPEAGTLTDELLNFKVKINLKTAHDSYECWREGVHDDLVLSVALALWYASRQTNRPRFRVCSG